MGYPGDKWPTRTKPAPEQQAHNLSRLKQDLDLARKAHITIDLVFPNLAHFHHKVKKNRSPETLAFQDMIDSEQVHTRVLRHVYTIVDVRLWGYRENSR